MLTMLLKSDDRVSSFIEKKFLKKKKPVKRRYPKVTCNLTGECLGTLYSNHLTKEDAEEVLKGLPFLIIRPFKIYAEKIDPETNNILDWRITEGFSLWMKPSSVK